MKCLRCNGTGYERKRPNLPRQPCYWCEGTGREPETKCDGNHDEDGRCLTCGQYPQRCWCDDDFDITERERDEDAPSPRPGG